MAKKIKYYSEAELIKIFALNRFVGTQVSPLMDEWLATNSTPNMALNTILSTSEQTIFDEIYQDALINITGWQEEDLKMNFIAFVLKLGHLRNTLHYKSYFEQTIQAIVEGYLLKAKTDFMIAKGILEVPENPYFHFQEYKKQRDPSGDPTAQLLEAFLIAQEKNKNDNPLYGCTIIGKYWDFVILEKKNYSISKSYDCTDQQDLLQIIAILRKFKEILETKLL